MPVYKKKQQCTQADGDKGTYTLYHKTKSGKEEKVGCATSKEKAQAYVKGSYAKWNWKDKRKQKVTENLAEIVAQRLLEYLQTLNEDTLLDEDEDEEISEIDSQFDQNWGKY